MERTATICVFGGSIAWGAYDGEVGGWVQRLRNALDAESDGYTWVYNLGVNDDTTEDVMARLPGEAAARKPNAIVFEIGLNDSQYINDPANRRTTIEQFQSNVGKLIAEAKKFTDKIAFLGLTLVDETRTMPIEWLPDRFYTNGRISEYNVALKSSVEAAGCSYISLDGILSVAELDDGIHPNAAGHEKIFRAVKAALRY